jgi:hypothetical protein
MKLKLYILAFAVCSGILSCKSSKFRKEADEKTKDFFGVLRKGDEKKLTILYPGFGNFEQYYKSDSAEIVSTQEENGIITVSVQNRFTNGFGKANDQTIALYFKTDSIGKLVLYDSKGLCDFDDKDNYIFGSKSGCIDKSADTTDQKILKKCKKATLVMVDKALVVYLELKRNIQVVTWNWESDYGGSASGKGIVRNNSTFSIPKLKFKVTYKDGSGNPITSDNGYVTYDILEAGESKSFTFYTSYIANATKASIELIFDDDLIFKYLTKKDWTGKECDQYFKDHPEKNKEL